MHLVSLQPRCTDENVEEEELRTCCRAGSLDLMRNYLAFINPTRDLNGITFRVNIRSNVGSSLVAVTFPL